MRTSDISTHISIGLVILLSITFLAVPFVTHGTNGLTGRVVQGPETINDVPRTVGEYEELFDTIIHRVNAREDLPNHISHFVKYAQSKGVHSLSEKDHNTLEEVARELGVDFQTAISRYGQDGRKNYIVELEGKPLIVEAKEGKRPALATTSLHDTHTKAIQDIQNIRGSSMQSFAANKRNEIQSFRRAFNGLSVRLSDEEVTKVMSLPYVKDVHASRSFKMLLNESISQIGADEAWGMQGPDEYALKGKDITIAVIDTGVDYTHPDLGNCTSQEFLDGDCEKVAEGYDFYNMDDDPMDDNGHGTHCSSIAAGDGDLQGVAPDATIIAYKVLSSSGSGTEEDILAAIERAVDPNMDFNTSDHYDIISMSLGGSGDPDDTLSTAIDNAAKAGVVPVIAAGNDGPYYRTIASPGCARSAITVGATCKASEVGEDSYCDDTMASFSSRGPSYGHSKPDIVAPGVNICAAKASVSTETPDDTCPEGYIAHSGTSMATPHVAGAAAILLQAHPGWTPSQVKASLKMTADDIEEPDIIQGHGEITIQEAANLENPPVAEIHAITNTKHLEE